MLSAKVRRCVPPLLIPLRSALVSVACYPSPFGRAFGGVQKNHCLSLYCLGSTETLEEIASLSACLCWLLCCDWVWTSFRRRCTGEFTCFIHLPLCAGFFFRYDRFLTHLRRHCTVSTRSVHPMVPSRLLGWLTRCNVGLGVFRRLVHSRVQLESIFTSSKW